MTREEAINIVRNICQTDTEKEVLATLIPELRESEDEKIRKDIIAFLQSMNSHCNPTQDWDLKNRWLPYLKKQKEPKTASDIEDAAYNYANNFSQYDDTIYSEIVEAYKAGAYYMELKQQEQKPSRPKTSIEILKHYLDWATNDDSDCPYTWEQLAAAIKDGIAALEQKQVEWSERDEKILASVMSHIADSQCFDHFHDISKEDIYAWLKSLRPQPKCEWNEEDEENFKWFDKFFRAESVVAGGRDIPQDKYLWFKSFRNRPKATDNWKPSEEQMDCLAMTLTSEAMDDNVHDVLSKFYDNLKKLMEE